MKSFRLLAATFFLCYYLNDVSAFSPNLVSITKPSPSGSGSSGRTTSSINPLFAEPESIKIKRDWEYEDDNGDVYKSSGRMTIKVFLPEEGDVKGCVYFMHGFSQYTEAYEDTLAKVANYANVAIISPETGITSPIVVCGIFCNLKKLLTDFNWSQFVLQRALSEDTKQCIRMVINGDEVFKNLGIPEDVPMGVAGHSMGGGLSFAVAANITEINYVFTMAPYAGVPEFDPVIKGINVRPVENSMLLAGSCDFIAKAANVKDISAKSIEKCSDSSTYVEIEGGVHTGFEDELVITKFPLDTILGKILSLFVNIPGFVESIIFGILGFLRTNTGQLDGSEKLMEYFFQEMVKGQKVTAKDADQFLKLNLKPEWYEKFNITTV